jgi:hypothetical protein
MLNIKTSVPSGGYSNRTVRLQGLAAMPSTQAKLIFCTITFRLPSLKAYKANGLSSSMPRCCKARTLEIALPTFKPIFLTLQTKPIVEA